MGGITVRQAIIAACVRHHQSDHTTPTTIIITLVRASLVSAAGGVLHIRVTHQLGRQRARDHLCVCMCVCVLGGERDWWAEGKVE